MRSRVSSAAIGSLVAVLILSGCSSPEPNSTIADPTASETRTPRPTPTPSATVECPPTPIEVTIDYELTQVSGGVQVAVATNLPDGAEVMTSFFRESPSYFGQDVQPIRDGGAVYGPFADDGSPLSGAYELSISLSIALNQPVAIQKCIGADGELLTGPLVLTDDFGHKWASLDVPVVF